MNMDLPPPHQQTLARAAEQNGAMVHLYEQNNNLIGYGWYDRLTKANRLRITVTDQNGDREIKETQTERKDPGKQRPDRIVFTLQNNPNHWEHGVVNIINLPADVAFDNTEHDNLYNAVPLVTKDSAINAGQLSGLLMEGFFNPSNNDDSDSYDTQEFEAERDCDSTAIRLLSSQHEATIASISHTVEQDLIYQIPEGMTVNIRAVRGKLTEVTLEAEAPAPGEDD